MIFFYEYKIDLVNSIKIFRVKVKLLPRLRRLRNINEINLAGRGGVNVKDIRCKYNYKFLPLTVNSNDFGKLIVGNDDCFKYVDLINEKKIYCKVKTYYKISRLR